MDSDYPASALRLASESEGAGLVLNERYTFEEYIYRRGNFLGRQPEYAHLPNACFIARRHAAEVYPNDQAILLVQDVRAREVATQQDPLLPLPTTTNTETIDGFATCLPDGLAGQTGGGNSPKLSLQPRSGISTTQNTASEVGHDKASAPPVPGRPPHFREADVGVNANQIEVAPTAPNQSTTSLSPNTPAASAHAFDTSSTLPSSPGPVQAPSNVQHVRESRKPPEAPAKAGAVDHSTQAKANEPFGTPNGVSDKVDTFTGFSEPPVLPQVLNPTEEPIATPLVQPGKVTVLSVPTMPKSMREQILTAAPGVSAMAGYGMKVPVKSRGKRDHDEDEAETASVSTLAGDEDVDNRATSAPPKKKVKTAPAGKQAPSNTDAPIRGVARAVKRSAANTKAKVVTPRTPAVPESKTNTPKTAITKTGAPKTAAAANLDTVINGLALPKTKEAAIAASDARRAALISIRTPAGPAPTMSRSGRYQKPTTKNTSARASTQANLMPEFFPPCTEEGNDVHCICGVEADDNEHMVQCEKCFVWQHSACLLPEMTKNQLAKVVFLCQVCDPWERRTVLKELRKREGRVD
ncbi:hypothetical protein LTR95_014208 [Oleoguttula sp. CCFEE 5521]